MLPGPTGAAAGEAILNEVSDYVVVGGGTAGCILAARLSEDPGTRVTLLEAGPPDRDPWIHIPAGYARLSKSRRYDWGYATEPEPELNDRVIAWPRGKVLGGSGSVNGLVFLRGSPHDYDRWAQAGARGWAWDDVAPVFRGLERWEGEAGDSRGKDGPIPVSEPRSLSTGAAAFIAACQTAGFRLHRDINDGSIEGVAAIQMNVHAGRRVSTAQAYLKPARGRPNLRVITGASAQRVVVADGRATGVQVRLPGGEVTTLAATREVVLCSGAIATPHLLLLSGIGDGAALAAHGIAPVLHRPAVGQNLQDHLIARLSYRTRPAGTLNEITASKLRMAAMALGYAIKRSGPMAVGATEATLFARATPGAEEAELQYQFINFSLVPDAGYVLPPYPGVMMNWGPCRPDSRGSLTLRSADPADRPIIHANYLSAASDRHLMLAGARIGQRIARSDPFAALVEEELYPPREIDSDEELLAYIRATATTVYHPCGTCRMGADDAAVLDPALRIRGLDGLRVADASAMPLVPSSNIQPAVMMLAERAAGFIRAG
ncbi:GMC family oxidoreductase [Acidisphaera sp. L21]|uniref:GMC family oxidoreductase n=1 Tax=Acidisphaera sp. L21 TaxID=1641851 RepID=UPI0020B106DE|nr:GMC family oxidoreductase N-terminal domain-containing protein [Acidisphaera sp. L21]